jgi:hypothetical protein
MDYIPYGEPFVDGPGNFGSVAGLAASAMVTQRPRPEERDALGNVVGGGERLPLPFTREQLEAKRDFLESALLYAQLAHSAYPESVELTKLQKAGFLMEKQEFRMPSSGLHAVLLRFKGTKTVVLSFQGTEVSSARDWVTNVLQGIGLITPQYYDAIRLAGKLKEEYGDNLYITGHSLGGGLATACAVIHKVPAMTFNAAGVHPMTILVHKGLQSSLADADKYVTAVRVNWEILSTLQDSWNPVGMAMPDSNGKRYDIPGKGVNVFARHGMDSVISAIQTQLNEVNAQLAVMNLPQFLKKGR